MNLKERIEHLPHAPGVYFFLGPKKEVLYIGKATSLRDRVRSYFASDLISTRGPLLVKMLSQAADIDFKETASVLEALMLESSLIKTTQPPFNTKEKDDKSYYSIIITDEDFPRVFLVRSKNIVQGTYKGEKILHTFGPFPHGSLIREALKITRKIFPFRDTCEPRIDSGQIRGTQIVPRSEARESVRAKRMNYTMSADTGTRNEGDGASWLSRPCFNAQLGLCPGVCSSAISKTRYQNQIKSLALFLSGDTTRAKEILTREMQTYATEKEFEKAEEIKRRIEALGHIRDIGLMKRDFDSFPEEKSLRMESYDIAHLAGKETVGVMVVSEQEAFATDEYRIFNIREAVKGDDTGALAEVIRRRFAHNEWQFPDIIIVDGGAGQKNAVEKALEEIAQKIPVLSVVKDEKHAPKDILGNKSLIKKHSAEILRLNAETHRFALASHTRKRTKQFLKG